VSVCKTVMAWEIRMDESNRARESGKEVLASPGIASARAKRAMVVEHWKRSGRSRWGHRVRSSMNGIMHSNKVDMSGQ